MYEISTELYQKCAEKLLVLISDKEYFSGSFELSWHGIKCRMILSIIIYRSKTNAAENATSDIERIVPVWWEFHTYNMDEVEIINDFYFNDLNDLIKHISNYGKNKNI